MMSTKKAPVAGERGAATGTEGECEARRTSCNYYSTLQDLSQYRISDFLHHGSTNTTSARELGKILGWKPREVTRAIEAERRSGTPICANGKGYFLPEYDLEVDRYLSSLQGREHEIRKTRSAIAATRQQRMDLGGGGQ